MSRDERPDEPRSEPGHATPEGYTEEKPAVSELGEPGTPGAGMTADVPHAADAEAVEHGDAPADAVEARVIVTGDAASVAHHDATTHMDAHTAISDDDHGHAEPRVGPIDWGAWGYAILGALAGLVVVALFFLATTRPPA
jgi:hypothetical protein